MAKRSVLKLYKSYMFRQKDPAIDLVRTAVADSEMSHTEIHNKSGVSIGAINGWFYGETKRPQHCTLEAVARACGKKFVLQDK